MNKTGTIFDIVQTDLPKGQQGYFELAENAPQPKDNSFFNTVKDYSKTILKGSIEGLGAFGRMMGPLQEQKSTAQQLEEQSETLNRLFPTDEGFGQSAIRRGLKQAPSILAMPGSSLSTVPRIAAASVLGEGAKKAGAPEWLQATAEITAFLGPDITKKLLQSGKHEEIVAAARKFGLTDEQITPLLQSDSKQKWLSKIATKTGSAQESLQSTKSGLSNAYKTLQESPAATAPLSKQSSDILLNSLSKTAAKMPAGVRNKIKEDMMDLVSKPITGESLMNLYADINHYLGDNAKQLSLFKTPIKDAIKAASPELAKDFELVNEMYGKYSKIASKLKPSLTDQVVRAVEAVGVLGGLAKGVLFGDYSILLGTLTEKTARQVAKQMLLNPRYQQLSRKMVVAMNQNKYPLAVKVIKDLKEELSKISPEASSKVHSLTKEEFENLFNHQDSENIK